ncbi:MAG: TraB/GumN family protein [Burkholderiales bacterium]
MLELSREDGPGRVVLLGTVHAGLPRFYPLPPQVGRAFADARSLLVEIDTEAQADAIRAAGVERHLIARTRARPIPVVELERADAQVRAFAGGTHDEQDAALAQRLAQREAHARSFGRIVDAWRVGNLDRLAELKDLAFPPQGRLAPLRRRLFAERDEGLADGLAAALDAPRTSMALVGVLHLAGPDSLQHALARRGISATAASDARATARRPGTPVRAARAKGHARTRVGAQCWRHAPTQTPPAWPPYRISTSTRCRRPGSRGCRCSACRPARRPDRRS